MTRSFFVSSVLAAVAACSLLTPSQASARAMGGFSIDTTGPVTPTPWDPWGGVMLCTANLRKYMGIDSYGNPIWQYQMASGYTAATCYANAQIYINMGYSPNPNPGTGYCACHSGFNGLMVASPSGDGPLGVQNLSQEQMRAYDDGLLKLREKYQFDKFLEEQELLLESIEAMPGAPESTPNGN